ncbi:MAG: hypothetical protein PHS37_08950, partial [Candidatus Omnitrophica bacterium]|nr:hypothetical protein [Candidatus Omnitrophota bacterium]
MMRPDLARGEKLGGWIRAIIHPESRSIVLLQIKDEPLNRAPLCAAIMAATLHTPYTSNMEVEELFTYYPRKRPEGLRLVSEDSPEEPVEPRRTELSSLVRDTITRKLMNRLIREEQRREGFHVVRADDTPPPPAGSIYSVFKYLCDHGITSPEKALVGETIAVETGTKHPGRGKSLKFASIEHDLNALFLHLHLIEKVDANVTGKDAKYYVPEAVKKKREKILPFLEQFRGKNLRPHPETMDRLYTEHIEQILNYRLLSKGYIFILAITALPAIGIPFIYIYPAVQQYWVAITIAGLVWLDLVTKLWVKIFIPKPLAVFTGGIKVPLYHPLYTQKNFITHVVHLVGFWRQMMLLYIVIYPLGNLVLGKVTPGLPELMFVFIVSGAAGQVLDIVFLNAEKGATDWIRLRYKFSGTPHFVIANLADMILTGAVGLFAITYPRLTLLVAIAAGYILWSKVRKKLPSAGSSPNLGGLSDDEVDAKIRGLIKRNPDMTEPKDKVTEIVYENGRFHEYEIIYDNDDTLNIHKHREALKTIKGKQEAALIKHLSDAGIPLETVRLGIIPSNEAAIINGSTAESSSIIHAGGRIWLPRDLAEYLFTSRVEETLLTDIFKHEYAHQQEPGVDIHARAPDDYNALVKRVNEARGRMAVRGGAAEIDGEELKKIVNAVFRREIFDWLTKDPLSKQLYTAFGEFLNRLVVTGDIYGVSAYLEACSEYLLSFSPAQIAEFFRDYLEATDNLSMDRALFTRLEEKYTPGKLRSGDTIRETKLMDRDSGVFTTIKIGRPGQVISESGAIHCNYVVLFDRTRARMALIHTSNCLSLPFARESIRRALVRLGCKPGDFPNITAKIIRPYGRLIDAIEGEASEKDSARIEELLTVALHEAGVRQLETDRNLAWYDTVGRKHISVLVDEGMMIAFAGRSPDSPATRMIDVTDQKYPVVDMVNRSYLTSDQVVTCLLSGKESDMRAVAGDIDKAFMSRIAWGGGDENSQWNFYASLTNSGRITKRQLVLLKSAGLGKAAQYKLLSIIWLDELDRIFSTENPIGSFRDYLTDNLSLDFQEELIPIFTEYILHFIYKEYHIFRPWPQGFPSVDDIEEAYCAFLKKAANKDALDLFNDKIRLWRAQAILGMGLRGFVSDSPDGIDDKINLRQLMESGRYEEAAKMANKDDMVLLDAMETLIDPDFGYMKACNILGNMFAVGLDENLYVGSLIIVLRNSIDRLADEEYSALIRRDRDCRAALSQVIAEDIHININREPVGLLFTLLDASAINRFLDHWLSPAMLEDLRQESSKRKGKEKYVSILKMIAAHERQPSSAGTIYSSPAECLIALKKDDAILAKALSEEGIAVSETDRACYQTLEKLGICLPIGGGRGRYRLSDMMKGAAINDTKTFINALVNMRFRRDDTLLNGAIPEAKIPAARELVRMTVLHEMNLMTGDVRNGLKPFRTTMWHIIDGRSLSDGQRPPLGRFIQALNKAFEKADLSE